ncbi:MAG: YtxH domain-containing protein [Candidatus Peregrinibacteria bacterium]|nr:YtxH domain-containing protein [Candidatus Peregrinibacteria bacterium]MDZ4244647.1 YtxH domain-containing protein [Candidatus Gracilibacteria bacterium]
MDNIENIPDKGKKQSTMDKVIFGLLIGGAIGSVLGLTVAPDKGKATRKEIKKRGVKLSEKGREILDENEDAVAVVTNKSKGVIDFFADKILGREKKVARKSSILDWLSDMETIPNEDAEEISQ